MQKQATCHVIDHTRPWCQSCFWAYDDLDVPTLSQRRLIARRVPRVSTDGVLVFVECNLCASRCFVCNRFSILTYSRQYASWTCMMCATYSKNAILFPPHPDKD